MRKQYPTFPKFTNLIVWQEPDPGPNALLAAFNHQSGLRIERSRVSMSCMEIYSKDLRIRAVAAPERGMLRREVVETFRISLTTLKRWLRMSREGKDLSPRSSTVRKRRILSTPEQKEALWSQLEANDDATTLERHCELWEHPKGVRVSISPMSRAIRNKLGWSYKKRHWVPPSETNRHEVLSGSA
jgi:transposase